MFERKMRKDRRGLTLIELVCAVAILGIITATVGGAMVVATNSYRSGTVETAMQQEAQFTANAIESLIIDATDTVEYVGNVLKIANVDYTYEITYDGAAQTLRYTQYETATPANVIAANELIAEHVKEFDADTADFDTARTVRLVLTMENEGKTFSTAYNITSRNNPDAGVPIEVTAVINAMDSITLEPNQDYLLQVSVVGPADTRFTCSLEPETDHTMDCTATVTGGGIQISVGTQETGGGDGLLRLQIMTVARGADGAPLQTKWVTIKIRRVLSLDFSSFTLLEGTPLKAGAVYSLTATPTGTNLAEVAGAVYEQYPYKYVDPNTVKWSFEVIGGSGVAGDYVEIIDPPGDSSNEVVFKLKQDIPSGGSLRAWATAQHPNGINKTGTVYSTVKDRKELVAATGGLSLVDSMLRRGDECYVDVDLDPQKLIEDEWNRNHPGEEMPDGDKYNAGFTGNIYFRYKSTDGTETSSGFPGWIRMAEQGNNPTSFKFNAGDFAGMKFMKDYTLEILYSFRYNTRDNRTVYYPACAYPSGGSVPIADVDPTYIYTFPMYAFAMGFEAYQDGAGQGGSLAPYVTAGGCGIGTFQKPLTLAYGSNIQLSFNVFTGATAEKGGTLESVLNSAKCYKWNGSSWTQTNVQLRYTERQNKQFGKIMFEPVNSQMQKGVVYKFVLESVQGETYANEPVDGLGGRGILYIELE